MKTPHQTRLEAEIGRAVAARLSESTRSIPSDISERLRAARERALAKRKVIRLQFVSGLQLAANTNSPLSLPEFPQGLWSRIAAFIPLLALVFGLLALEFVKDEQRAAELAEVDAELLADELPPAAFTDPGFVHFLSTARRD